MDIQNALLFCSNFFSQFCQDLAGFLNLSFSGGRIAQGSFIGGGDGPTLTNEPQEFVKDLVFVALDDVNIGSRICGVGLDDDVLRDGHKFKVLWSRDDDGVLAALFEGTARKGQAAVSIRNRGIGVIKLIPIVIRQVNRVLI